MNVNLVSDEAKGECKLKKLKKQSAGGAMTGVFK